METALNGASASGSARRPSIAVVLPGGGARGAYEAGALSVLLPALEARGERVSIWCGTSVGAINATAMASLSHLPTSEQTAATVGLWSELRKGDVISPIIGSGGLRTLMRLVGHGVRIPSLRFASLLDPSPLAGSLDRWIDWRRLSDNVARKVIDAVCVVATSLMTGDPVAFVSSRDKLPRFPDDAIRYVGANLRGEHVRASAAIPMLFPTVQVTTPRSARGHYADGGTRLNSPIKPALHLGADRVILIGLEPFGHSAALSIAAGRPSVADVAANVLDGLLVDQVANDLHRMAAINSFFVDDASRGTVGASRAYRLARGRAPYRPISYALVSPQRRGEIGRLAEKVFANRYGGLRGLRDLDFVLMAGALGSRTRARGELLSFLLFDSEFVAGLLALGARDAKRWLRRHPRFWCRDAAHDLSFARYDRGAISEQEAIEEFRARRYR
ncbi:MAG: patatin-like phospholipase family protein [Solirubrobacteraceae bacterium]